MVHLVVPGEPIAQGRPRFSAKNGIARAYDPRKSREYKDYVRTMAKSIGIQSPLTGPLYMTVNVYRSIPRSWTLKKQTQADIGAIKPTLKPDVDNYVKGIKDALNGVVYVDDAQVVVLEISKHYSFEPRVEITVREVNPVGQAQV